jgi:hypothetical protein
MAAIKGANLALAFVLEVCMLVALGYWGFRVGPEPLWNVALGIGAPLLAGVVWGLFVAPKAVVKVSPVVRQVLKLVIFGVAVGALFAAGQPTLGVVLGLAFVVNFALLVAWGQ